MIPERTELARFFGPRAQTAWVEALARIGAELGPHYQMSRAEWCAFLGQIGHETDGLSLASMRENTRYTSAERVKQIFSYRLALALKKDEGLRREYQTVTSLARACVGNPELLANIVYGGREGTPWMQGARYIGRGPTQITHRDNYEAIGEEIRRQPGGRGCPDLVNRPETLEQPDWGVRSAFADWKLKQLSHYVNALSESDIERISAVLNTGSPKKIGIVNGMSSRKRWTAKALGIWPATTDREMVDAVVVRPGTTGESVKAIQARLRTLGYGIGAEDGDYGLLTTRAVRAFQAEHGLKIDGEVGPRTLDSLNASAPAELPRRTITAQDLAKRGSEPVKAARRTALVGRLLTFLGLGGAGGELAIPGTLSGMLTTLESAREQAAQVHEVAGWLLSPVGLTALGGVACVGLGMLVMRWSSRAIDASVSAAQSGLDLSV